MRLGSCSIVAVALHCLAATNAAPCEAAELDVRRWLDGPGVKLVVVEFYAKYCKPCMDAVPQWRRLHAKYYDKGLRLVVVNHMPSTAGCPVLGWSPDANICDMEGQIGRTFGIESLPSAYLWSWQGNLLVRAGHIDEVEQAIVRYLATNPRVLVRAEDANGRADRGLKRRVEAELSRTGKFTVVADRKGRAAAAALRKASHGLARNDTQRCQLGKEVSASSILLVERHAAQLVLILIDATTGCQRSLAVPWRTKTARKSVATAIHRLLGRLRRSGTLRLGQSARLASAPSPTATPVPPSFSNADDFGRPPGVATPAVPPAPPLATASNSDRTVDRLPYLPPRSFGGRRPLNRAPSQSYPHSRTGVARPGAAKKNPGRCNIMRRAFAVTEANFESDPHIYRSSYERELAEIKAKCRAR